MALMPHSWLATTPMVPPQNVTTSMTNGAGSSEFLANSNMPDDTPVAVLARSHAPRLNWNRDDSFLFMNAILTPVERASLVSDR
jgi:hypothetical protein